MTGYKLARKQMDEHKSDIRARYLNGESIGSIAKSKGVVRRTIYYHLGKLSLEDQKIHGSKLQIKISNNDTTIKSKPEEDSMVDFE